MRMVYVIPVVLAACLDASTTPATRTETSELAAQPDEICAAQLCDDFNECPACSGTPGSCGSDGVCHWSTGGGGGGGGGGPRCSISVCNDVSDCYAACPNATQAACLSNTCVY